MKWGSLLLLAVVLFVAGCEYDAPLTERHSIAIDRNVLGLWEPMPDDEEEEIEPGERMMILKFSDTEYLVHYPIGKNGIYYRAYPMKLGGVSCVQLQALGTEDGPLEADEKELYHVVSYRLVEGALEIKTLNTGIVDDHLKTGRALRKAFLENKNNEDLFSNPARFKKIEDDE
ncbi:MAG: hypothetical protein HQ559_05855 [Lentisphaerae bacterium]|nr:hypothetical protein [Lentisphaerota bacterium]